MVLPVKPLRMAEQKLPNVFADPGIEDFVRTACTAPLAAGSHAIDIHALECDEEMIAIFADSGMQRSYQAMVESRKEKNQRHDGAGLHPDKRTSY